MKKLLLFFFMLTIVSGNCLAAEKPAKLGVGGKIAILNAFVGSIGLRVTPAPNLSYELNYLHLPAQYTPENVELEYFDVGLYYLYKHHPEIPSVFAAGLYGGGTLRGNVATSLVGLALEWRYNFFGPYWSRLFYTMPYANGEFSSGFGLGMDYYF